MNYLVQAGYYCISIIQLFNPLYILLLKNNFLPRKFVLYIYKNKTLERKRSNKEEKLMVAKVTLN